jgi:hypothetical protein
MAVTESSKKATEVSSEATEKSSFWTPGRVSITLIVGVLVVGYAISRGVRMEMSAPHDHSHRQSSWKSPPARTAPLAVVPLPWDCGKPRYKPSTANR